jgi:serine/threonine protein phosphatase PrpC
MAVRTGAATDRGRMRPGNEDNYVSRAHLFAVADGLGGHQAGEVASKIAVDTLASLDNGGPWTDERTALDALRGAIKAANRKIREAASTNRSLEGMGTTITAVLENGDTLYLAHVGDSRAYLYRNGQLTRLTDDHSLVQQLVNEGRLTPEEAEHHPQRSIITRALGMDSDVEPDTATYKRRPGDRLLLCTDGLSGVVDEADIRRVLNRFRDPQEAAEELIARANEEGGPDNITVVVIDTDEGPVAGGDTTELGVGIAPPQGAPKAEPGAGFGEAPPPVVEGRRAGRRAGRPRRRIWRRLVAAILGLGLLGGAAFAIQTLWASRYWVGFQGDEVVVFRGFKGDVAGIELSRVVDRTGIKRVDVLPGYAPGLVNGVDREGRADAKAYANCTASLLPLDQCLASGPGPVTTTTVVGTTATTAKPGAKQATSTTGR